MHHRMLASYGSPLRIVDSAQFDGADLMKTGAGLTGAADSKSGIFSAWYRLDNTTPAQQRIISAATTVGGVVNRVLCEKQGSNFEVVMRDTAGSDILNITTVSNFLVAAGASWYHLLASWDLATAGARHLYVNDVSDLSVVTFTNSTIDYTLADWAVGGGTSGTSLVNGCLAEVYFAMGQYLDFSIPANRRKFRSASGKPVHLGTDGSAPLGVIPGIYTHLDDGEAAVNFATNRGAGGNFAVTSGALSTGSTSPSD